MGTKKRSRLTFAEVLVTAAIVAVLASLLLPVFARARDEARQAVCLGNINTICRAVRMYLTDNDARFPPREMDDEVQAYFSTYPGGAGPDQWDPAAAGSEPWCHRAGQSNPYLRWHQRCRGLGGAPAGTRRRVGMAQGALDVPGAELARGVGGRGDRHPDPGSNGRARRPQG